MAKKEKTRVSQAVNDSFGYVSDTFKSNDIFGKKVDFNYNGKGTFQTLPGGLISVAMKILVYSFTILILRDMIEKNNWTLTS